MPWGFSIVGDKYDKKIIPTDLCRAIVPEIFARCINGDSLRMIASWLDSEGIPTPRGKTHWNESTIRWTIRQRAYAGRLQTGTGETILRCEAVISPDVFDRANQALRTRPKRGPVSANKPMLAKLRCVRCGSPMYRILPATPAGNATITAALALGRSARDAAIWCLTRQPTQSWQCKFL